MDNRLLVEVIKHLGANWLSLLTYSLVMLSAFTVISTTHNNRQLSIQLEGLMQQQDELDVQWRHLVLEQSALTEHNRIENLVNRELKMFRPKPEDEVIVSVE